MELLFEGENLKISRVSSRTRSKTRRLDWTYLNVQPFVKIDQVVHAGGECLLLRFDRNRVDGEAVHEQLFKKRRRESSRNEEGRRKGPSKNVNSLSSYKI